MTIYSINNPLSDDGRNKLNHNFEELNNNIKKTSEDFQRAEEIITEKAFDRVVDSAKIEWLPPVNTFNLLNTTYPNATTGKTVMTRDNGKVFRKEGTSWVEIQQIDAGPVNEVDSRLTAQLAQNVNVLSTIENKYDRFNTASAGTVFVSFVDDDGHLDVFNVLKTMFDKHGVKFSSAIITNKPNNDPNYMTWEQIKQLENEGHEIMSHTHTHRRLGDLSTTDQIYEMEESKKQLLSKGFFPKHFVYPQGDYNNFTLENVLRYYRSGVATQLSAYMDGLKPPLLEGRVGRISLGSWQTLPTNEIKQKIEAGKSEGKWIIFTTHVWANNNDNPTEGNVAAIQDILEYCTSDENVNIITYDEGFRRYANKQMIGNNSIVNKPYHVIGADYQEYTNINNLKSKVQKTDLSFSNKPSDFELNNDVTVSYKEMTAVEANTDLAPVKLAGLLITETLRLRTGYIKQTYKVYESDDIFIRTAKANDTWGAWTRLNPTFYSPTQILGTEPPSYFKTNCVTYKEVPGFQATNLPGARAGLLITERFGNSFGYVKQTYKHHQLTDVYVRSGKDDDTWTTWVKISTVAI